MDNKKLKIHIFISVIAKGLAMLISFAYTSVILNYLGEELYGLWAIVLNLISMIYYFDIGVGNGLRNRLVETETKGDHEESTKYVSTGYIAAAIISVLFCSTLILLWNVAPLAAFFNLDIEGVNANLIITISLLFLLVNFIIALNKTIVFAIQKAGLVSIATMLCQLFQLIAVLLLWWLAKADVVIVAIVFGSVSLLENVMLGVYVRVKYPYLTFKKSCVKKEYFKPLMSLGIMFFIMQISTLILNTTDNLLISRLFSVSDVTPYNISYKVFYLFVQVHGIIIMPMWSAFTEAKERKDFIWIRNTLRKINLITLLFAVVAFALIFVFKPLAYIWLHKELEYGYLIIFMATYVIITMFANNYASLLCGVGEVKVASFLALIQALLNIPLSIVLAKYTSLGINGIILGSVAVMVLSLIVLPINYYVWINKKITENRPGHLHYDTDDINSKLPKVSPIYGHKVEGAKFSFYIPTYKRPELLKQSLGSLVNQKYDQPYEILVVDNNPDKDNNDVLEVVKSFNSSKIVYYKNESNLGMIGNWNRATQLCSSNIIIHLGDDDVLSPYYLSIVSKLVNDDFYGVLGVNYKPFSEEIPSFEEQHKVTFTPISLQSFFHGRNINIAGMLYTKDFFYGCGGFKEEMYPMADTYFISEAAKIGYLYSTNAVLAGYRIDNQNTTLKDDTLMKIIEKYHSMRKSLYEYDRNVSSIFPRCESTYLDSYISGAESYWKKQINREEIYHYFNLNQDSSSLKKTIYKLYLHYVSLESSFKKKTIRV